MSSETEARADFGDIDELGPVDYIVVEFPGNRMTGEAFPILVDLVDRGVVRIFDFVFIRKEEDGTVTAVELQDLGGEVDLSVFEGLRPACSTTATSRTPQAPWNPAAPRESSCTRTPGRRRSPVPCDGAERSSWPQDGFPYRPCWRRWTPWRTRRPESESRTA